MTTTPETSTKSRWRLSGLSKFLIVLILIISLCNPVSLIIVFHIATILHDTLIMHAFSKPFFGYPLPPATVEISRDTKMSYGGSHGCAFVAIRVVQSSLTLEELEAYFVPVGFGTPHGDWDEGSSDGFAHVRIEVEGDLYQLVLTGGGFYGSDTFLIGCRHH